MGVGYSTMACGLRDWFSEQSAQGSICVKRSTEDPSRQRPMTLLGCVPGQSDPSLPALLITTARQEGGGGGGLR